MRASLPQDWDGQTWECVTIQWPKSTEWFAILASLVWRPQHGRFWDEKSGSIQAAQAVGWEIVNKNIPFKNCDGKTTGNDGVVNYLNGSSGCACSQSDWEIDEMPCLDISRLLKIEGGKLFAKNDCCEWVEIGALYGQTEEIPEDLFEDDENPPEYSSCGKAEAMTSLIKAVGESCWDERDNSPNTWWGNVKSDYYGPGSLSVGYVLNACLAALDIEILQDASDQWYGPELFDESTWQSILCALDNWLDDTATLPDKDTLFSKIESIIDGEWPIDLLAQSFWYNVMKAIGENDIRNAGLLGATNTDKDCGCPVDQYGFIGPSSNGWYLGIEKSVIITGTGGFTYGLGSIFETPVHDVYGMLFEYEFISGDPINTLKRNNSCALTPDFCMVIANSDTHDTSTSYLQMANQAYADLDGYFDNPEQLNQVGKVSDIIASPLVTPTQTVEARFAVRADGAEGVAFNTVRVKLRWLHNTNSPSHT